MTGQISVFDMAAFDMTVFDVAALSRLFNQLFERSTNTRLAGGAKEPLYQPAMIAGDSHYIYFTQDYFASALHEVAHWCIAGKERRRQVDYGYWYVPDGRNPEQQRQFERVEAKPQALEWIFCRAAQFPFQLSVDNLAANNLDKDAFKDRVWQQVQRYCQGDIPARGAQFAQALRQYFNGPDFLESKLYAVENIK